MWSWAGFWMKLYREEWILVVTHALEGVVIEIYVSDLCIFRIEGLRVHRKPVVLRSDVHFFRALVAHRMVSPVMAKLQLEGTRPQRLSDELVTQADAEDRELSDQLCYQIND